MAKPLAGRRAFEAMGRRARSLGLSIIVGRAQRDTWPYWARSAYSAGWIMQCQKYRAASQEAAEQKGGE